MKVTGMRAAQAMVALLEEAGLGLDARTPGVEGWIQPNYANSLGFGIQKARSGGGVEWNLVLSGRRHLAYEPVGFDPDASEGEEPSDPGLLHGRIRAVFEELGLKVTDVRTSSWSTMWDDDVSYIVTTDHPEWLEAYNPRNTPTSAPTPLLTGFQPTDKGGMFGPAKRGELPGYAWDGKAFLTRESVEALVEASGSRSAKVRLQLEADGTLVVSRQYVEPSRIVPETVVNHWGDAVAAWRMPAGLLDRAPLRKPSVPFVADGEMRDGPSFRVVDAQFGEAPWSVDVSPAHRP